MPCIYSTAAEDSVTQLKDVEVRAQRIDPSQQENPYTGSNVTMIDSMTIANMATQSLSSLLSNRTPIFVKENGNGMMSSISLRGTAASQTAVVWDGISINSLTMGQTDLSLIPVFFFNSIEIAPGGESSLYGNGAIGGGLSLNNFAAKSINKNGRRFGGQISQSVGSYGNTFSGAKVNYKTNKFFTQTNLFYNQANNEFHFTVKDFGGEHSYLQKNASYHNWGVLQELGFQVNERNKFGLKFWHTQYNRNIQPSIQNNNDPTKYEDIQDRSTKIISNYKYDGKIKIESKIGYLNDHETFQGDLIATHDLLAKVTAKKYLYGLGIVRKLNIEIEGQEQYIKPEVDSYKSFSDEWRTDLAARCMAELGKHVKLQGAMRQEFVSGIDVPFTPSVGGKFYVVRNKKIESGLKTNFARNYKVPTLNDRYWGDMDNKYLEPENGTNIEGGMFAELKENKYQNTLSLTAYHNDVENWIMWMPRGNVWKPQNIDHVLAKGIEIKFNQNLKTGEIAQVLDLGYTYSHTEVLEGFAEMRPFVGRQIALIPEHSFSFQYNILVKQLSLCFGGHYVGERRSSDIYDVLDAYCVTNGSIAYSIDMGKEVKMNLSLTVNNIFNEDYQSVPYKAMPHRNYLATINIVF